MAVRSFLKGEWDDFMIYIAVCDVDNKICSFMEHIIRKYARENAINVEIDIFYSGEALCKSLESSNYYDLICLDIQLQKMSGIDVGLYLREKLGNDATHLIYISASTNHAMKLFQIRPLNFLVKPVYDSAMWKNLHKAVQLIEKQNLCFQYKKGRTYHRILYSSILYFKSEGKKVYIILDDDSKEFYGKIDLIMSEVPLQKFIRIHKSYIINLNYIKEYCFESVKMSDGEVLAISKTYRKDIREKILSHMDVVDDV